MLLLRKVKELVSRNNKKTLVIGLFVVGISILLTTTSLATTTPVKSITMTSKNTSFENKEQGSWKAVKSAKWISKEQAQVTFDIDTTLMTDEKDKDIVFILDTSSSMTGNKLDRVKQDTKELVKMLLSNNNNQVALISFSSDANLISGFTTDQELLLNEIDDLTNTKGTSYFKALIKLNELLRNYQHQDDRELIVLFLTDGYPAIDTPNQDGQYQYLKKEYPYITINAIQYEMGGIILNPIKKISDNQYLADMKTLNNVLFDASLSPNTYENFQVIDYIDDRYFDLEKEEDITVSNGEVKLEEENGTQKITWTISDLRTGEEPQLTMKLKLKEEYVSESGVFPTNEQTQITTKIKNQEENVSTTETPSIQSEYQVIYDSNAPSGCTVEDIPSNQYHFVLDTVEIPSEKPSCNGYEFKGWEIVTDSVEEINDNYFIMPESNVTIRAKWSKVKLEKTMSGEVYSPSYLYDVIKEQAVMDNIASTYVSSSSGIQFGYISSDTNGKGIYELSETENDEFPIYYYRGDINNNHVKFAGYCWEIVRTTSTGGVKLIYDGEPGTDGICNKTGADSQIGKSAFSTDNSSLSNVGYMVGPTHGRLSIDMDNASDSDWVYGNDVVWDGNKYTLVDTVTSSTADWLHERYDIIGSGHRYTCRSDKSQCSNPVSYVTSVSDMHTMYSILLYEGDKVDDAIAEMVQSDNDIRNQDDSTIKTYIDTWFENNLLDYQDYLEDTPWCNDRTVYQKNNMDNNYVIHTLEHGLAFGINGRDSTLTLDCPDANDAFTVNSENGNGKLTYPIALITADELKLAGFTSWEYNHDNYLYTNQVWWTLTPNKYDYRAFATTVNYDAVYGGSLVTGLNGVRPSISLTHELVVTQGDGTEESPYEIAW